MKDFIVKQVPQPHLEEQLNAFAVQDWIIIKLHPEETEQVTYWTIVCEREKP